MREVSDEGSGKIRKEVRRESFGPVLFTVSAAKAHSTLLSYSEVCGQCLRVIKRIVAKCGPVTRGGYRARKVAKKRSVRKVSKER